MAYKRWQDDVYYSVQEVVKLLGWGEDWVRDHFRNEPGVMQSRSRMPNRKKRRDFVTLRIPGYVITRVVNRLSVPPVQAA